MCLMENMPLQSCLIEKINLVPRRRLRPLLVLVSLRLVVLVLVFSHLLVVVPLRLLVLVLVLCRQLRRQLRRLLVRFGYSNGALDQMEYRQLPWWSCVLDG